MLPPGSNSNPTSLMAGLFLLGTALSFGAALTTSRPNILLIVADDMRPDTIRALGNTYIETPNLDRLATDGVAFTRAITAIPHCLPSLAELMTGATGFRNLSAPFGTTMNPSISRSAETMRQAGYRTAFSGKWHNQGPPREWGFEETLSLYTAWGTTKRPPDTHPVDHAGARQTGYTGWTFKDPQGRSEIEKGVGLTPDTDRFVADAAIEFVLRPADTPFFLQIHLLGPHDPLLALPGAKHQYTTSGVPLPPNFRPVHPFDHGNAGRRDEIIVPTPRTPYAIKRELAAYYTIISAVDGQVGRLVEALRAKGKEDSTLVIFTSDNGLALGSHGLTGKQNMYDHSIGVPLIMAGPGVPRNQRFPAQVYLRDLFPTICNLVRIPIPDSVEGLSLVPLLTGKSATIHPETYGYWHRAGDSREFPVQRMMRTDRWKIIYYSSVRRYQLFDLVNDPNELRDLSSSRDHDAIMVELRRKLEEWFAPRLAPYRSTAKAL